ncbi:MAG: BatD family protein [Myxococcota bacterium]
MSLAAVLWMAVVNAANPVHAVVDRSRASTEDQVTLTVVATDLRAKEPEIPKIPGARVERRGRLRSTQIINGVRSESLSFKYAVFPRRKGTLRIPAIPIRVGTRVYKTNPIRLEIDEGSPGGLKPFFAVAEVSETQPYRSQQVVYTLQLYAELLKLSCKKLDLPNFDKFIAEDLGKERRFQTVRNGRRFSVLELRRSLFPLEAGVVTIPAAEFTCTVTYPSTRGLFPNNSLDQFLSRGRTETKVLRSLPITLDVKALPPPTADFSNIVGKVEVTARMSQRKLVAGNSVTQTIFMRSDGNLRGYAPPQPEISGIKIYDDREAIQIADRGNTSETTFQMNRAFVPVGPGRYQIPGFSVSYFNPQQERYERATAPAFALTVSPNPNQESLGLVDATGLDAKSPEPVTTNTGLMPAASTVVLGLRPLPHWLVLLAAVFPPLSVLVISWWRRTKKARSERAPLKKVLAPLHQGTVEDADLVEGVLREILRRGDERLRTATASEVVDGLVKRGVPSDEGERTAAWLRWAEAARYGGDAGTPPEEKKALESLLTRIDHRLAEAKE